MRWLDTLERRLGRLAVPNIVLWIVIAQVLFYALGIFTTFPVDALTLQPGKILQGEIWRLATFVLVPEIRDISIWVIFVWYLLMIYGTALEAAWGSFRLNLFVIIGVVATAAASIIGYMITPFAGEVPIWYFMASFFLAFAALNPNFELLIFFVLPVKVKWLAWLTWAFFALHFLFGPIPLKLIILAASLNLLLFFGKNLFGTVQAAQRRKAYVRKQEALAAEPFHRCTVCGITDKDDPNMDFVYENGQGYCRNHANTPQV